MQNEFVCIGNICFSKSDVGADSNSDSSSNRRRIVTGYASVQVRDLDNDIFTIEGLKQSMENYMRRGGLIFYDHKIPCGNLLSWEITEKDGVPALYIEAELWNMREKFDDFVWSEVQAGKITGFSIRGFIDEFMTRFNAQEGIKERIINGVDLREISLVYQPANPEATLEQIIEKSEKGMSIAGHDISLQEFERRLRLIEKMIHRAENDRESEHRNENKDESEKESENGNADTENNVNTDQYITYLAQLLNLLKRNEKSKSRKENKITQCMREKDREGWNLKDERERKQALAVCYNMTKKGKGKDLNLRDQYIVNKWIRYENFLVYKHNVMLDTLKEILRTYHIPEHELPVIMDYISKHRYMALFAHLKKYRIQTVEGTLNRVVQLANEIYQTKMMLFDLRVWFINEFYYLFTEAQGEGSGDDVKSNLTNLAESYAQNVSAEEKTILDVSKMNTIISKAVSRNNKVHDKDRTDIDDEDIRDQLIDYIALEQIYVSAYKTNVLNVNDNIMRLKSIRNEFQRKGRDISLMHRLNEVIDKLIDAYAYAKQGHDKGLDQVLYETRIIVSDVLKSMNIRVSSLSSAFYDIKLIAESAKEIRTIRASAVNLLVMNNAIDQKTIDMIKNASFNEPILHSLYGHLDPDNQRLKDYMFSKNVKIEKEKIRLDNEICKALRLDQDAIEAIKDNMIYEITNVRQYRDLVQVFYSNINALENARKKLNREGKVLAVKPLDNIMPELYNAFENAKRGNFKAVKPVLKVYDDVKKTVNTITNHSVYLPEFSMLANLAGSAKTILQVRVDTMHIIKDTLPDYNKYIDEDEFYSVPLTDSAIEAVFGYLLHPEYMDDSESDYDVMKSHSKVKNMFPKHVLLSLNVVQKHLIRKRIFKKQMYNQKQKHDQGQEQDQKQGKIIQQEDAERLIDNLMQLEETFLQMALSERHITRADRLLENLYTYSNYATVLLDMDEPFISVHEYVQIYRALIEQEFSTNLQNVFRRIIQRTQRSEEVYPADSLQGVLNNLAYTAHSIALYIAQRMQEAVA